MQNRDRDVVMSFCLGVAVFVALSSCVEGQEDASTPLNGKSVDGGSFAPDPLPPVQAGQNLDAGSGSNARSPDAFAGYQINRGEKVICDPSDSRYCRVARAVDGIYCPEDWEVATQQLTCSLLPRGRSWWNIRQGPSCLVTSWVTTSHQESCYYDSRTGKLIASHGEDACGIYCGEGIRSVWWNEYPVECGQTMEVASAECGPDGTELPPTPPPAPTVDAGKVDRPAPPIFDASQQ